MLVPPRKEPTMTKADQIIAKLNLAPHPEGGWYRQTWAGPLINGRATGTAIHFLLKEGERSHWHRVDADEIWLWHAGAPLILSMGDSRATDHILGPDVLAGQSPQLLVPQDIWQAARAWQAFRDFLNGTPEQWREACALARALGYDDGVRGGRILR